LRFRHHPAGAGQQAIDDRHERGDLRLVTREFDATAERSAHGDAVQLQRHFFECGALTTSQHVQQHD
jgi:hypothetical protein